MKKLTIITGLIVAAILMAMPSHAAYDSSLSLYLKFDEATGATIAEDATVNNNDGVIVGDPTLEAAGQYGTYAYDFDGAGDYLRVADSDSIDLDGPFTVAVWMYIDDYTPSVAYLLTKRGTGAGFEDNYMYYDPRNATKFVTYRIADGVGQSVVARAVALDTWYHIVCVYDGSDLKMYVDGVLRSTKEDSVAPQANDTDLTICSFQGSNYHFDGRIDELAIWKNMALDAFEVDAVFDVGVESFEHISFGINDTFDLDTLKGYDTGDINQISQLYADQGGTFMGPGNILWKYIAEVPDGYGLGDAWQDGNKLYVQLEANSDGLQGTIPEPASMIMFVLAGLGLAVKRRFF